MTTIPEGFEQCELKDATHVVTAGAGLQKFGLAPSPRNYLDTICFGKDGTNNISEVSPGQFETLGIIPVRKIERKPREWVGRVRPSTSGSDIACRVTWGGPKLQHGEKVTVRIIEILDEENA